MADHDERLWELAGDYLLQLEDEGWTPPDEDDHPDAWGLSRERLAALLLLVAGDAEDEDGLAEAKDPDHYPSDSGGPL